MPTPTTVIVGAPGCYPTATILALAPLAREGLIGDLVVDAKSGVSGAGREAKPDLTFSEVNESVKAYGIGGHRHVAEMEQELGALDAGRAAGRAPSNPGAVADRLPAAPHPDDPRHPVGLLRAPDADGHAGGARRRCTRTAYADEPFVQVVAAPPATKHVMRQQPRAGPRPPRRADRAASIAIGVIDNLVKGAAGQAVQAFNLVHGLDETAGLDQLPLEPVADDGRAARPPARLEAFPDTGAAVTRTPGVPVGFRVGGWPRPASSRRASPTCARRDDRRGPAATAAVFTANAFAAAPVRLSQEHLAATEPAGHGRFGWSSAVVSTSGCANAATGAARASPTSARSPVTSPPPWAIPVERTLHLSTGLIGTRLPLDKVAAASAAARRADGLGDTPAHLEAAATALRTTDSRTQAGRRGDRSAAVATAATGPRPRQRHREGRRHDPSADGHDAVRGDDGRDASRRPSSTACCGPPPRGRGTS